MVIPRIVFRGANAQPAWWLVGPPGPMPILGFSLALCRAIGIEAHFLGAGAVLHDHALRAEKGEFGSSLPHQQRGAALIDSNDYANGTQSLSAQPTARCDGIVSVIVAIHEDGDVDASAIAEFLDRGRIAGGTIAEHRFNPKKGCLFDTFKEAQERIGGGFSMVDRADLLVPAEGEDPLDAFLRATRRYKTVANGQQQPESWLVPYAAGYQGLTTPSVRRGTRDNIPHAFAEPLVGLMQFVPRSKAPIALWRYAATPDNYFVEPMVPTAVAA